MQLKCRNSYTGKPKNAGFRPLISYKLSITPALCKVKRKRPKEGEDSLSLASLDSSLREGAKMPPSMREVAWRVSCKRHDGGSHLSEGEDSLSLASLDSSLREGAEMPPSLREVAWRVPRKLRDGGSHLWKGEDSLSLASLDSSLGEGAEMPLSLREVAWRVMQAP